MGGWRRCPGQLSPEEYLEWKFTNPAKSLVFVKNEAVMMSDFIKEKGATSVARHTPEFAGGAAPQSLALSSKAYSVQAPDDERKIMSLCLHNAVVGSPAAGVTPYLGDALTWIKADGSALHVADPWLPRPRIAFHTPVADPRNI